MFVCLAWPICVVINCSKMSITVHFKVGKLVLCRGENNYFTLLISDSGQFVLKCKIDQVNFNEPFLRRIFCLNARAQLAFCIVGNHCSHNIYAAKAAQT